MTGKYDEVRIGDVLLSLKTGLNPRKNFSLNTPGARNWYITVRELNGVGVDFLPQTDMVDDNGLKLINARSNLEIDDILFSGTGTIGKTAIVQDVPKNWGIKEGVYVLKPDKTLVNPYYLLCMIRFYSTTSVFTRQTGGSTVFSIPMKVLADTKIKLPALVEQDQVATFIKQIDDKISINNRIVEKLNEIIDLLYNYWFVQFDFPDKNGQPYKSSGGNIHQQEDGKLGFPDSWTQASVGTLIKIRKGISYTSEDISSGRGLPMINLGSIDKSRNYRDEKIKYFSGHVSDEKIVRPGDMLLACTDLTSDGLIIGCPIFVPSHHDSFTFSMDLAKIDVVSGSVMTSYLYKTLRTEWYHDYIKRFSSGTNVRHLDVSGVLDYKISIPDIDLQRKFEDITWPMFETINNALVENQKLSSTRDWLLPMLMTGHAKIRS